MTVVADKITVRAAALARREALPETMRQAAALRLVETGLACLGPGRDLVVSAYQPIRGEVDPGQLLVALASAGFRTSLPLTLGRDAPLQFRLWQPGAPLTPGRWGIPEPQASAPQVDPDVLFVPLAAFDRRGFRLGYGAGYYDNALARLRGLKPILAIGVAYAAQEVEAVPVEPHDQRLDRIVTENETLIMEPTNRCAFSSSAT